MKKKKYTKVKIVLYIGIINLLVSLLFAKERFEIFLFFFVIFSICFIYSRKLVLDIIGRPIIKEICKLHNKKVELQTNIKILESKNREISSYILNKQKNIDEMNKYKETINDLKLKEKQYNIKIIKLEDKQRTIEQIIKQEQIVNRAIEGEERTFNLLSEENSKLEEEKESLIQEVNFLKRKSSIIKEQVDFINKYTLNDIDNLEGFEFERFCTKLLLIDGYEKVQNTKESVDYGIDIIAEKDNIKYAVQCKRYEGKVGNDAIQEAMTGKEYYGCNIAIVLTNSTFTHNAQRLSKSAGVILWDRSVLSNIIKRNKEKIL